MERISIKELMDHLEQTVTIAGWLETKRDHGKMAFLDIKDSTGKIQTVCTASQEIFKLVSQAKEQSSVTARGKIARRPASLVAEGINGEIEMQLTDFTVVASAKDFPWGTKSSEEVNEELRMRYRYLDMRNDRVKNALKLRSKVTKFIRDYLHERDFVEIETPYITKGTPEGAREYLVPSRLQPGLFYALPQSPQQFKQLLMVGGFDRYFSIARCFRDEDPRGDRQPEFTQLDLEMSFVGREDVLRLTEALYVALVKAVMPDKQISQLPFPRLTYVESIKQYGNDKPDLRQNPADPNELAFAWVVDQPLFEYSKTEKKLVAVHHLFTRPKVGDEKLLVSQPEKALADSYDLALNGYEIGGGSIRIHEADLQRQVFRILGISDEAAEKRFGHLLEAFSYGPPPHGGIAQGIDRLVMLLANEPNIRAVIAFPKTGDGRDLLMGAPSLVSIDQLKALHIKVDK